MVVRNSELKNLQTIFDNDRNPLVLLYGSCRAEKEQLLKDFCRDKKVFYYRARNASKEEQLNLIKAEIEKGFKTTVMSAQYDDCFKRIKSGDASKLVVIIDEFQLVHRKDESFFNSILKLKAKQLYPGPVMIILTSSSLSYIQAEFLEEKEASKFDYQIKLNDVSFLDVVRAFPDFSVKQSVEAYGILGGVPKYLNYWSKKRTTKENICSLILNPNGALFNEAENFISTELRELSVYGTILASIARGNEKLNDLFLDTGYSRAKISVYMKNLAAFDVVEKVISFETGGWENAKKGVYRIKNNYVNFFYRFIYPNLSDLYLMSAEEFYDVHIKDELDAYLRRYFVQVCQEYVALMNLMGNVPVKIRKLGTWVGKQGTIDIIGQDDARNTVVGICNWENDNLSYEKYEELKESMKQARITATAVYLFSAKSFDPRLAELSEKDSSVILVDMTEL